MILIKHYYTEKEYKILLSHLVILHDTRENTNSEILDFFDKQGIAHEKRALNGKARNPTGFRRGMNGVRGNYYKLLGKQN